MSFGGCVSSKVHERTHGGESCEWRNMHLDLTNLLIHAEHELQGGPWVLYQFATGIAVRSIAGGEASVHRLLGFVARGFQTIVML